MNIAGVAVIGLMVAIIAQMLKRYNPEISMMVSLCAGILIAMVVLSQLIPAIQQIEELMAKTGLANEYGVILFKALGICFLAQFASDSCRDVGENALAGKIEFAGKIAIVITALPLFQAIITIASNLIG